MTQEELVAELLKRGVELDIGGCSCCSSPWIKVKIDGNQVWDSEGDQFDFLPD